MSIRKEFQRIILPLLKASPILIALIAITVFLAKKGIEYLPTQYQSMGAIKINNLNSSQTGFDIFQNKENNTPMQNETFLTEVEIFKSKDLIRKTLQQLNWEMTLHRVGEIRQTELYQNRPFQIEYQDVADKGYDREFHLVYKGNNDFHFLINPEQDSSSYATFQVGKWATLESIQFRLTWNDAYLDKNPHSLNYNDHFVFKINSLAQQVTTVTAKELFVRPVEKDISIIKIYYQHELPEKAKEFVDALMHEYMEECRTYKEQMSDETIVYLDRQIEEATQKLRTSESSLAYFRTKNHIVNTRQETETTLKEITQLDLQNIDFEMQEAELTNLYSHLTTGNSLHDYAPNFKALADPIFQQSYLKVQALELEKKDLLVKYLPESPEVNHIDSKAKSLRVFINESVRTTLENLKTRKQEVENSIQANNDKINTYPEKEKRLVALERAVSLNENMYNYLVQKRTELAISRSSNLYPHKIVEVASLPKELIAPNKSLIIGLCVFLVLSFGIVLTYIIDYFLASVKAKEDIEDAIQKPILGTVWKNKKKKFESYEIVSDIIANIDKVLPETSDKGKLLIVSSMTPGEGKSYVTTNLGQALAASGQKVLLVDMDMRRPSLHDEWAIENMGGVGAILEKRSTLTAAIQTTGENNLYLIPAGELLTGNKALLFSDRAKGFIHDMRHHYDYVIVDSAPIGIVPDAIPLMNESSANLFVLRLGHTKRRSLGTIEASLKEWDIPNMHLVLNDFVPSRKYYSYYGY